MKMKNLKIMRKAGIKVPDFFVISWEESVKNQISLLCNIGLKRGTLSLSSPNGNGY